MSAKDELDLEAAERRRTDAIEALSEACKRGRLRMQVPVSGYDHDVRIQSALNEYETALDEVRRLRAALAERDERVRELERDLELIDDAARQEPDHDA